MTRGGHAGSQKVAHHFPAPFCLVKTPPIKVAHRFVSVNFTDSYKYLGLFLTNTLNMSSHIKKSMKTASSRLNLLKRVCYFIDSHTASTIYRSMIIPTMTYCPLVTSSSFTLTQLAHLARLENRAKKNHWKWRPSKCGKYSPKADCYVCFQVFDKWCLWKLW